MKYTYKLLLVMLFLASLPLQGANAATGSTDVSIDFPDIIILHYINDLSLTFTGDLDEGVDELTGSDNAALATTASFDGAMTASTAASTTLPSDVTVTVQNVWAVRGITGSGQIRVTPSIDTAAATDGGTSSTSMSNIQVKTASVAAGNPIDVDAPGFVLANAVLGDVVFDLDVSTVVDSSDHTGMQYTITATATP